MPNHIQNRLKIFGTPDQIKKVFSEISGEPFDSGEKRTIDFNKIIPAPENMFRGDLSMETQASLEAQGIPHWHGWQSENWGTKWNAYQCDGPKDTDDTIYFQTAWAAPIQIIEALARKFPDTKMSWDWADEDTGRNTGRVKLEDGKAWFYKPMNDSIEAYELCFDLGYRDRDDYELVDVKGDGNMEYRYKEDEA
jgi:hypothetical protein